MTDKNFLQVPEPAREKRKKIFKMLVLIYLAGFLIINWNDVSWVFNYRAVTGLVGDFFNPYPSIDANSVNAYFYPNHSQTNDSGVKTVKNIKTVYTDKQNTLEIPKINISVPIIFSTTTDKGLVTKDLDAGVVYYPGSVYPGEIGQAVILGHSAPIGWPKIKHDWVFSDIEKLVPGDLVLVDLNNKQYTYKVIVKTIIKAGADVPSEGSSANNVLTLISCWPPGKDYQRIAVTAELVTN